MIKKINIHKFGGASTRDTKAISNLGLNIIPNKVIVNSEEKNFLVFSTQEGVTRKLEKLFANLWDSDIDSAFEVFMEIKDHHFEIFSNLVKPSKNQLKDFNKIMFRLWSKLYFPCWPKAINKEEHRAEILQFGEILNIFILKHVFNVFNLKTKYINAQTFMETKRNNGLEVLSQEGTLKSINDHVKFFTEANGFDLYLTEGFIGRNFNSKNPSVLDLDGSDITAAILARGLKAESVTFWKDVNGIYTDDPLVNPKAKMLIEMDFKRLASIIKSKHLRVIHPDSIRILSYPSPIKTTIRSFINLDNCGTLISKS